MREIFGDGEDDLVLPLDQQFNPQNLDGASKSGCNAGTKYELQSQLVNENVTSSSSEYTQEEGEAEQEEMAGSGAGFQHLTHGNVD